MANRLDYLFIDEAGQVSIANLAAMSGSTTNIVLMGDQMQLAQPTQGSHPGESGQSCLEYYLQDHATVPPDMGLFLGQSWRMHPDVCSFISETLYGGRLTNHPGTASRIIPVPPNAQWVPQESGIVFSPVEHENNVYASEEEAARIKLIIDELVGRPYVEESGSDAGTLTLNDILVVAPYNMQVRLLENVLPHGVRVGSVDLFQGQESKVVILSMCSSPGDFGSRGLEFLLNRNRINVAISRAQCLAIVVGEPRISTTPVNTTENMERANLYCRLTMPLMGT